MRRIATISLLVRDYDEAIDFYVNKLQFILIEDTIMSESKRWVVISPSMESGCNILLAKAKNESEKSRIGDQTGGRVFLFIHTDDFEKEYQNLKSHDIKILRTPEQHAYGKVLVFEDLYGNKWDLIQPK